MDRHLLSMLALPPAVEEAPVEQPEDPLTETVTYTASIHKCAVRVCTARPTHQVLVVAHPGEETFTFQNLQTCVRHIPLTAQEVFPQKELDGFQAMYPHTTHFSIKAYALA